MAAPLRTLAVALGGVMDKHEDEEFTNHLHEAVRQAEKLKYFPSRFKGMLNSDGGYETVKRILASGKPSEGFTKLWELGRLELTCEAIIVETKWRHCFDDDLLERAEKLLRQMGYPFKPFESHERKVSKHEPSGADDDDFVPSNEDDRDFTLREAALRPWQGQFREALFERYGARCCISGCAVAEALEAAHITPYQGEKSNDPRNGLVLRSDLHTLFDRYLLGIDPGTLRITLSSALADPSYQRFDGKELVIGAKHTPSKRALEVHWRKFIDLKAPD